MKNILILLTAMIFIAVGCSNDKPTLHVYNWADYIDPDVVAEFSEKYKCNVTIDQFDDNEAMLAKMLVGSSGFDVIFPSTYTINALVVNNLIQKLDCSLLPNVMKNFDEKFKKFSYDSNMTYSVPYAFSMTGICYKKDKMTINDNEKSWNIFFDKRCQNRICLLNDQREMIGIGLKLNHYSVNSTNDQEISEAICTMLKFKRIANKLDNIQYKTGIISGEFFISMGYNSDALQIASESENDKIGFFIPIEGSTCCIDEMCIPRTAKNAKLAHEFINFMYDPMISAKNAKYICTAVPNKNMWEHMTAEEINNELYNITEKTLLKLESINDVGENLIKYNQAWDKFKMQN